MNFSSYMGFIFAAATLWFTVIAESPNPHALLELKGFALVVGGTLSAGLVIFPFSKMWALWKFIIFGVLLKQLPDPKNLTREIIAAAALTEVERPLLARCPTSHPFLREAFQLIAENELSDHELKEVLTRRSQYFKTSYINDAKMLTVLAKFPSSFGMLGSTVGLIDMMSNLGKNGAAGIGPAMAMALVATFWGLVFTYMILMPLADYAIRLSAEDNHLRQLVIEGALMIKRGESQDIILEKLNSFLALQDRLSHRKIQAAGSYFEKVQSKVTELKRRAAG